MTIELRSGMANGINVIAKVVFPKGYGPENSVEVFTILERLEEQLQAVSVVPNAERVEAM